VLVTSGHIGHTGSSSQIIHEAKRSCPCVLYLPHLNLTWRSMSGAARDALVSILADVAPSQPLLVLATAEECDQQEWREILFNQNEVCDVRSPSREERELFFLQVAEMAQTAPTLAEKEREGEELEVLPVHEDMRSLNERELKRLKKREEQKRRQLRIFLRECWNKINREQRFFMFR